jgi:glutamate synthase domain-containing protein 2/glutamate synthase domain-containing protein 1/glutamate synthase domain-containing protein 3
MSAGQRRDGLGAGFTLLNAAGDPAAEGLYDPLYERDSCGVGFVAALDAVPRMNLVTDAIRVLINLEHRGAVGGDKSTGDGAGLLLGMPDVFLRRECQKAGMALPMVGEYGVAMLFLPSDPQVADSCRRVCEQVCALEGVRGLGWRQVPVRPEGLGDFARLTMPAFAQFFVERGSLDTAAFERKLVIIRRTAERQIAQWKDVDASQFYVASFSALTLVYKGMLTGTQLKSFFPDLTDPDFTSAFAIVHQRYSTNTLPNWKLAQPFRLLAHNGEINTLRGNANRMRARQAVLKSKLLGDDLRKFFPVIDETGSDSAQVDNVLELLTAAGRSLPHAAMMMVPEAWGAKFHMSEDKRAFYEYHSAMMEPWDGPAALVFTDGRYIGAVLDRNGLRPARYTLTADGLIVLASETGVLDLAPADVRYCGRLQPGRMLLLDLEQHRIVPDREIKAAISRRKPYRHWVKDNRIELRGLGMPSEVPAAPPDELRAKQQAFGYSEEELKMLIGPMAAQGQEAVGSMGNDVPLAVLSKTPQLLFAYFKQLFAQVTNPPIDPLREELVMSLMSYIGHERNLLEETPEHCRMLKLHHPVLTPEDMVRLRGTDNPDIRPVDLPMLFPRGSGGVGLRQALDELFARAAAAIRDGAVLLLLTDRGMDREHAPIPALLAASGLHHFLIREGLRTQAGIIVESGEVREVIHVAMAIAFGANAVCPHVALSTVRALAEQGLLSPAVTPNAAVDHYIAAVKKGLLKTLSRMGISTIRSFLGSQIFEAVGLGPALIERYFTGTASRVGGIDLDDLATETQRRHEVAFPAAGGPAPALPIGGNYHTRQGGERHLWTPAVISALQQAVRRDDYRLFQEYCRGINDQSSQRITLRSLTRFTAGAPVPIDEVEAVDRIVPRFVVSAMSFGSISKEAHEAIAIAMNHLGARSNSGEGGEDPARYRHVNGDNKMSRVKQVASGRFGVTLEYLTHADELQIKMAQGAKPGEGGQLPGHKVSADIARVRHTTPGVTLISPPPHHDIYSIEDLAQLIYDLKCVNPTARVSVKLVSEVGVGTIAAGVAKARADMVLIAGHDGGTGASPLTAIKHAGLPWELGLAETQQALRLNGLRDKIRIQVDGQLRTGRDLAIAALLGAEEFGFATVALVSLGCVMMRKCHSNTCPVGVATQDPRLRARFCGRPEHVERFFRFLAQDFREVMAELGFRSVDEMIGHSERLAFEPAADHPKTAHLDFSRLLRRPDRPDQLPLRCLRPDALEPVACFDDELIGKCRKAIDGKGTVSLKLPIRNTQRTVGARLSQEVARRHGPRGLADGTIDLTFVGSAGQSFGAFLAPGLALTVLGDVNDYLAKGMSGGRIVVRPNPASGFSAHESIIAGNVILYGATAGEVFLSGQAGERFAVRNSGATAVVEGVGDHGCEYMTGGTVVVLGGTGNNFAAGMSGGIAYVYDESGLFDTRCNLDMVDLESVWSWEDQDVLNRLLTRHVELTGSERAKDILNSWENRLPYFVKVFPIDYRKALERMRHREDRESETLSATEEVYPHTETRHR